MTAPPTGSTRTGISRGDAYTVRFWFETVCFELRQFFLLIFGFVNVARLEMRLCPNVYYLRGMACIHHTGIWNNTVLFLERGKYYVYKFNG